MDPFARDDLAYCEIDGRLIFLDIAADRYFRLPDEANVRALAALDRSGLERWRQPSFLPRPCPWMTATRQCQAMAQGDFRIGDVARAVWSQRRVERRLACRSFASLLRELRAAEVRQEDDVAIRGGAARTICAFEQARLLRSSADRCLPRSIALALALAADGSGAHIVIGVKLAPFAAHCWTQAGDEVLNDSVEEVARYKPMLVV